MRASRLVAVLLHIQREGRATAPELAHALEVSVRTIYRDIAALQAAGVPLWTEPGPSGGVRLVEGWRFPLDGLSGDETAALVLGGAASDLGLGAVLTAAHSKVVSALPAELRSRATRIRERFHVDAPHWFRHDETPHLATVAEAVWAGTRLDIRYERSDRVVARRLDPLGLVVKGGTWYLVAASRGTPRTYRVSRITSATARAERSTRPDGFDLATWWGASRSEFDLAIRRVPVVLRLTTGATRRLVAVAPGDHTRAAVAAARVEADGWHRVELRMETVEIATSQLASLGEPVEVLDPPELRAALREHAAALARLNV